MEVNIFDLRYQVQTMFNNYKDVELRLTEHIIKDRQCRFNTEFSTTEFVDTLKKIVDRRNRPIDKEIPFVYLITKDRSLRIVVKWEDHSKLVVISSYTFLKGLNEE